MLEYAGLLRGMEPAEIRKRADELLPTVETDACRQRSKSEA